MSSRALRKKSWTVSPAPINSNPLTDLPDAAPGPSCRTVMTTLVRAGGPFDVDQSENTIATNHSDISCTMVVFAKHNCLSVSNGFVGTMQV